MDIVSAIHTLTAELELLRANPLRLEKEMHSSLDN